MKIISYNVNGIRAALKKGFAEWLASENPDIVCLQELKATADQIEPFYKELGYELYTHTAEKKGYSGVAILTKHTPKHIEYGCGNDLYDSEGRVIRADFDSFSVMSVYMPSGTSGDIRQGFKYQWLDFFYDYSLSLKASHPNLVLCGDYNIAHTALDIHNPVSNKKSSGFLPEERSWFTKFIDAGFIDTFRLFNDQQPHQYSWWSYRANARANNKGWRIDYHMASTQMESRLKKAYILQEVKHSDHCPVVLEID